jgi:Na+/H+ antiporter NhaD/arsenite permease-like protein
MKKFLLLFGLLSLSLVINTQYALAANHQDSETTHVEEHDGAEVDAHDENDGHAAAHATNDHDDEHGHADHESHMPPVWLVIPFVALLLMIATGPLFYAHFWHHHYPKIAIALGLAVAAYYVFVMHDTHQPLHSLFEYISFISLLTALFVASGGILLGWDKQGTPGANVALLIFGAAIANIIGTTGASMLLIRPFVRLNKGRVKPFHIVFFIFMVSNVGGSLTPIGDPPLFLGFLKGVPFEWTIVHVWLKWVFGVGLLALIFYFLDNRDYKKLNITTKKSDFSGRIGIRGERNIIFLAVTIGAVFLDPNKIEWLPYVPLEHNGHVAKLSFIRELIMFAVAFVAYKTSDKECLKRNDFNFEPIKEVAFLFIGIFGTMMPALQLVGSFAGTNPDLITTNTLYWFTGALSGVLDNAPTYMNFLSAAIGKVGMDINSLESVAEFAGVYVPELLAISVASVFFGAMTYIGNAPNFMVKSIAEQIGIEMPSFVAYIVKYSLPFLLPVLFLTWIVFFVLL